ncbi:MAG: YeeE/YedE thiosulfate transporter family protein [Bacteroidota bacterium]|nr:YeeE/YedE thiosulfate transporter family protein [Bacteroidota bacterium]
MIAPLFKFGYFGDEFSLIIAVLIGIGFGFFLERAGFGSSTKLAAQFYFYDMTVLKVMFTAIVTAMVGLLYFGWLGILDLTLVSVNQTYLVSQIVGGLILGVGFVIGGYCPGTSVVACATGKKDAMVFVLGVLFGIFVFGELYSYIFEPIMDLSAMGRVLLPDVLHLSYGLVVFLVVVMAIGAFILAEYVEKKLVLKKGK